MAQGEPSSDRDAGRAMISVVVPVFNEEKNLPYLVEHLLAAFETSKDDFELIFVDDGSSDHTWDVIVSLHDRFPVEQSDI